MTKRTLSLTGRFYRIYPNSENALGHATEQLELDWDETGFLVVDAYGVGFDTAAPEANDNLLPFYMVDQQTLTIVRDHIRPARDSARASGMPIVYLTNYLSPGLDEGNEWRNMSVRTCDVDVLEAWQEPNDILAFSEVMAPRPGEPLIKKQMYSGFFETSLDTTLRARGIRNLIVVGFDSRVCLGSTVTDALYRNYRVVVLRDCVSTMEFPDTKDGQWANKMAIRHIEANVGYTSTSEDFIRAVEQITSHA